MALPVEINPLQLKTSGSYSVSKSLRFRSSASAYLSRTPSVTGNQTKFTISLWFKRGVLTAYGALFDAYSGAGANYGILQLHNDDTLTWFNQTSSSITMSLKSTAVYRDPSAWYHVVAVYDSAQATASNRASVYVNGVQITSFSISTYPTLSQTNTINGTVPHDIGRYGGASNYFDGYLAEVNFIDGQALTPSSFGAYDTNGVWQPAKYTGSYGTNGFYLTFGNTTSTATLGNDSSGNGNTWTVNNISLTAGTTYDSMTDSCTVSSATVANYAVLNPLNVSGGTYQDGNLTWVSPTTDQKSALSTISVTTTGNWYCEITVGSKTGTYWTIGVSSSATAWVLRAQYRSDGATNVNGTAGTSFASYTTGDIIGVTYNSSTGVVTFYKNNVSQGTLTVSNLTTTQYFNCSSDSSGGTSTYYANFGQRPFSYTPPTGFNALNTYNLPTPTIANGAQYMAATLYTGNGSTLTINNGTNTTIGTTFQPDFAWLKSRSAATSNSLSDVLRGIGANSSYPRLISDSTAAESTNGGITSFASTGLSLNADAAITNTNAATYVAWQWKAGGSSGVSNTNGSITSTVSANTTAGFSVVTYTGNGTAGATIGHGLGVAPSMVIIKSRSGVRNWQVYHISIGNTGAVFLNTTGATSTASTNWNNTSPTSSVVSLGTDGNVNANTETYVAYCFAAVAGYSAFGSYAGTGVNPGPFVYLGFRPRFIMFKNVSAAGTPWAMMDTSRDTYNQFVPYSLQAESSAAESSSQTWQIDALSNGMSIRNTSSSINGSGNTIIYAAFAENPFNSSRAR